MVLRHVVRLLSLFALADASAPLAIMIGSSSAASSSSSASQTMTASFVVHRGARVVGARRAAPSAAFGGEVDGGRRDGALFGTSPPPLSTRAGRRAGFGVRSVARRRPTLSSSSSSADADATTTTTTTFLEETGTLLRVLLPASLSGILATSAFPTLCRRITKFVVSTTPPGSTDVGMIGDATSSFVGLVGLLYSILMGQVFGFLYGQQEALYYALFDEVTEAKSLLEQVALVSQGRTMYLTCLDSIARYVRDDLLGGTELSTSTTTTTRRWRWRWRRRSAITPSSILSARPADDPLEAILYLTSVGTPGQIYDTVRSLRQARSRRLGAMQRKVPGMHLAILWILGGVMISSFPILVGVGGAAAVAAGGESTMRAAAMATSSSYGGIVTLQGMLFGVATFAVVMTKMVLGELWRTKARSGAYNVDAVLRVMVHGLQRELEERTVEATGAMKRRSKIGDE